MGFRVDFQRIIYSRPKDLPGYTVCQERISSLRAFLFKEEAELIPAIFSPMISEKLSLS